MGRRTAMVVASAAIAGSSLWGGAGPAAARPDRVPPFTSVAAAIPTGLLRPATTTTATYVSDLQRRLANRISAPALGSGVSVTVADLTTGEVLFDHRGGARMIPASTQKTATALAVLSARGPESRMPTRVMLDSDATTLTLVGGGDPLLSSSDLTSLAGQVADSLSDSDVDTFTVHYDDSLFEWPGLPSAWPWSYFSYYSVKPTALTRDLRRVENPSVDAAKFFRQALKSQLKSQGRRITKGVAAGQAGSGATAVGEFAGHTVAQAVWPMLQDSDNSIAEVLIRHVAVARGATASTTGAPAAVKAELAELGVPVGRMSPIDGSGLSRNNRITTRTLVGITRAAVDPATPGLATGFRSSAYPLAGISGTLDSRFESRLTSCSRGRVMAKTGSLTGTTALSGITSSVDGRLRAFAILVNGYPGSTDRARYRVDRIATAITGCR